MSKEALSVNSEAPAPACLERLDLGWRNADGDFGWLAPTPKSLSDSESTELFFWADSTRAAFGQHWYFVPLGSEKHGLLRVSPVAGGERGTASTVQVLVWIDSDLPMNQDVPRLLDLFPDVPTTIGRPAMWNIQDGAARSEAAVESTSDSLQDVASSIPLRELRLALDALLCEPSDATASVEIRMQEHRIPKEQMRFALGVFACLPAKSELRRRIAIATDNAPQVGRPRHVVRLNTIDSGRDVDPRTDLILAFRNYTGRLRMDPAGGSSASVVRDIAGSLLAQPDSGFEHFFAYSRVIAALGTTVRSCWQDGVEAEISRMDPKISYRVLDRLLRSSPEEFGFPPAWAVRILVSSPTLFKTEARQDFSRNLPLMARWFPARLAERIRECQPFSSSEVIAIVESSRLLIAESAPSLDGARGDLLRAAMDLSILDPHATDTFATLNGALLLMDCAELASTRPVAGQVAKEEYERAATLERPMARAVHSIAVLKADVLSRFLRMFRPDTPKDTRNRAIALVHATCDAMREMGEDQFLALQDRDDSFIRLLSLSRSLRSGVARHPSNQATPS